MQLQLRCGKGWKNQFLGRGFYYPLNRIPIKGGMICFFCQIDFWNLQIWDQSSCHKKTHWFSIEWNIFVAESFFGALTDATKTMNQTFIFGRPFFSTFFFQVKRTRSFSKHQISLGSTRFSSSGSLSSDLQVASSSVVSAGLNGGLGAPLGRGRVGIVIVAHDRTDTLARSGWGLLVDRPKNRPF